MLPTATPAPPSTIKKNSSDSNFLSASSSVSFVIRAREIGGQVKSNSRAASLSRFQRAKASASEGSTPRRRTSLPCQKFIHLLRNADFGLRNEKQKGRRADRETGRQKPRR